VSLHSIHSRSTNFLLHRRPTPHIATTATTLLTTFSFDTPFKILLGILGYWTLLIEAPLRSARLQGLLEVGPARLLTAMLGDLGVSTLHLIKTMTRFSSLFEHQTSHVVCFNARGLLYECVFDALLFFRRIDLSGNLFPITSLLDLRYFLLFFFGSSYRPSCPPRCSDTTHECIFDAL
jgi:hypothetical protein